MKKFIFSVLTLAALALVLQPVTTQGQDEKLKYQGANKCKMCHNKASEGKYYDDWLTTKHANAFLVLKGDERKDPKCLPCHTTGFGKDGGFTALEVAEPKQADMDKALAGVQCEVCHGPGEKHIKSKKDNVIKNAGVPDEKVCLTCHNDTNPHWNPERYTTKDGKKVGFDFEQAIKKVNHSAMKEKK